MRSKLILAAAFALLVVMAVLSTGNRKQFSAERDPVPVWFSCSASR